MLFRPPLDQARNAGELAAPERLQHEPSPGRGAGTRRGRPAVGDPDDESVRIPAEPGPAALLILAGEDARFDLPRRSRRARVGFVPVGGDDERPLGIEIHPEGQHAHGAIVAGRSRGIPGPTRPRGPRREGACWRPQGRLVACSLWRCCVLNQLLLSVLLAQTGPAVLPTDVLAVDDPQLSSSSLQGDAPAAPDPGGAPPAGVLPGIKDPPSENGDFGPMTFSAGGRLPFPMGTLRL